jgi:hypothetical protein
MSAILAFRGKFERGLERADQVWYGLVSEVLRAAVLYRGTGASLPGVADGFASIFVLLARSFIQPSFSTFFFADSFFASTFVPFLFDNSVRSFALGVLQRHLRDSEPFNKECPPLIANALMHVAESCEGATSVQIALDVLTMITGLLAVNRLIAHLFLCSQRCSQRCIGANGLLCFGQASRVSIA